MELTSRLKRLHEEALIAGDMAMAQIAIRALDGDTVAVVACVAAIAWNLHEQGEHVTTVCEDCSGPCIAPHSAPFCEGCGSYLQQQQQGGAS